MKKKIYEIYDIFKLIIIFRSFEKIKNKNVIWNYKLKIFVDNENFYSNYWENYCSNKIKSFRLLFNLNLIWHIHQNIDVSIEWNSFSFLGENCSNIIELKKLMYKYNYKDYYKIIYDISNLIYEYETDKIDDKNYINKKDVYYYNFIINADNIKFKKDIDLYHLILFSKNYYDNGELRNNTSKNFHNLIKDLAKEIYIGLLYKILMIRGNIELIFFDNDIYKEFNYLYKRYYNLIIE